MLARVCKIDVLKCESCSGKQRPICAVTDSDSIHRYMKSVDIDYEPLPRGPPRYLQDTFDFETEKSALGEGDDSGSDWLDRAECRNKKAIESVLETGLYPAFDRNHDNLWKSQATQQMSGALASKVLAGCAGAG